MTTEELNALIAQAEGGDVSAMNQVAHVYSDNADFKDSEKAFIWYKKSAELGNVNSMSNLGGWCYLQGNGTEKNIPLADEWLKKCVENGGVWTWAFNEIANIFANDAQYKDFSKAFYWYKKSAETGDVLGMSNLGGWCYLWGNGVEKNIPLAIELLEKAAKQDNVWSMNKLTYIYGEVEGYIDLEKAMKWFDVLIQKNNGTQSDVNQTTLYDTVLYEKVKSAFEQIALIEKDYEFNQNSPFRNYAGEFVIPEGVKHIGVYAFKWCDKITSIVIPNSVTSIGDDAFINCNGLTSVIIPNSVTSIGNYAFEYCEKLTSVTIPNSVTSIGVNAFCCSSLVSVNVATDNSHYCSIDGVLFNKDRTAIIRYPQGKLEESYSIPNSVRTIGMCAFDRCCNLTHIYIPNSVISIEKQAFHVCEYLKSITIPDTVISIGDGAFSRCTRLVSAAISNNVRIIEKRTFWRCKKLSSIVIPDSVTSIGEEAFSGCDNLASVTIGNSVENIGEGAFKYLSADLTSVKIPHSIKSIGKEAFYCTFLDQVTIPYGTALGENAFDEDTRVYRE